RGHRLLALGRAAHRRAAPRAALPTTTAHGGTRRVRSAANPAAATSPAASDVTPWAITGSHRAAARRPTTPALAPMIARRTRCIDLTRARNGRVATTRRAPGRKIATRAIVAPSAPEGPVVVTAPRKAATLNSGPGTAWAAP